MTECHVICGKRHALSPCCACPSARAAIHSPMARPVLAAIIVAIYLAAVTMAILTFPSLEPCVPSRAAAGISHPQQLILRSSSSQRAQLRLPRSIEDAKLLRSIFSQYTDTHYTTVIVTFTLVFLTYASPGRITSSSRAAMSGAL